MTDVNTRTFVVNFGPEHANDSTTSAQIPRYAERKHIAIILMKNGIALLLDGAGK